MKKERFAAGIEFGLMHSAFSFMPGLYRRLMPVKVGSEVGRSVDK